MYGAERVGSFASVAGDPARTGIPGDRHIYELHQERICSKPATPSRPLPMLLDAVDTGFMLPWFGNVVKAPASVFRARPGYSSFLQFIGVLHSTLGIVIVGSPTVHGQRGSSRKPHASQNSSAAGGNGG